MTPHPLGFYRKKWCGPDHPKTGLTSNPESVPWRTEVVGQPALAGAKCFFPPCEQVKGCAWVESVELVVFGFPEFGLRVVPGDFSPAGKHLFFSSEHPPPGHKGCIRTEPGIKSVQK